MTLWKLSDDANGTTICEPCDLAARPMMEPDNLADWLAYRAPTRGHCEYCGTADHTPSERELCLICRDTCSVCGHWDIDHLTGLDCASARQPACTICDPS
jgi:hypothetical protein